MHVTIIYEFLDSNPLVCWNDATIHPSSTLISTAWLINYLDQGVLSDILPDVRASRQKNAS